MTEQSRLVDCTRNQCCFTGTEQERVHRCKSWTPQGEARPCKNISLYTRRRPCFSFRDSVMFHCLGICSFINRLYGLFVSFMGSPLRFNKSPLKSAFVSVFFSFSWIRASYIVLKLYRAHVQRRLSLHHKIQDSLYRISDTDIAKEPLHHVIQRNDYKARGIYPLAFNYLN